MPKEAKIRETTFGGNFRKPKADHLRWQPSAAEPCRQRRKSTTFGRRISTFGRRTFRTQTQVQPPKLNLGSRKCALLHYFLVQEAISQVAIFEEPNKGNILRSKSSIFTFNYWISRSPLLRKENPKITCFLLSAMHIQNSKGVSTFLISAWAAS